tara:strand:- start:331 stop:1233 length:903 start_codon:yes stop_codon:yes gene_type:complete
MRSLVTGGAGFIGSNLVDQLLEIGHEVTVVDNESSDSNEQFYWNPKAYNIKGDIRDSSVMKGAFANGMDYVFHTAAEARIQSSIENPVEAVSINTLGTATVLQCAREAGVKRVMYSSTSAAYGMNDSPNVETQSDDCLNPYSISKVSGEHLCKMYTDLFNLPTVIFRYFNVYGNRQPIRGQYAPVIGIFMRQRDNLEKLTIVGDGEQRRDFVNVFDVVNANIMAAISNPDPNVFGQVYNVGTGVNYSINEIADMISVHNRYVDAREGEARETLADITKIEKTFGWKPNIKVEDWIGGNLK